MGWGGQGRFGRRIRRGGRRRSEEFRRGGRRADGFGNSAICGAIRGLFQTIGDVNISRALYALGELPRFTI